MTHHEPRSRNSPAAKIEENVNKDSTKLQCASDRTHWEVDRKRDVIGGQRTGAMSTTSSITFLTFSTRVLKSNPNTTTPNHCSHPHSVTIPATRPHSGTLTNDFKIWRTVQGFDPGNPPSRVICSNQIITPCSRCRRQKCIHRASTSSTKHLKHGLSSFHPQI